jgi:hypothetical protein
MNRDFDRMLDDLAEDSPIYGLLDDEDLTSRRRRPPTSPRRKGPKPARKKSDPNEDD